MKSLLEVILGILTALEMILRALIAIPLFYIGLGILTLGLIIGGEKAREAFWKTIYDIDRV